MKYEYEKPLMTITWLNSVDVICTSADPGCIPGVDVDCPTGDPTQLDPAGAVVPTV